MRYLLLTMPAACLLSFGCKTSSSNVASTKDAHHVTPADKPPYSPPQISEHCQSVVRSFINSKSDIGKVSDFQSYELLEAGTNQPRVRRYSPQGGASEPPQEGTQPDTLALYSYQYLNRKTKLPINLCVVVLDPSAKCDVSFLDGRDTDESSLRHAYFMEFSLPESEERYSRYCFRNGGPKKLSSFCENTVKSLIIKGGDIDAFSSYIGYDFPTSRAFSRTYTFKFREPGSASDSEFFMQIESPEASDDCFVTRVEKPKLGTGK